MLSRVFYSWQSDIKAAACRSLIQDALTAAASQLKSDGIVEVEPVIDRDTQGVGGAPDIGATIFSKIETADAFVADVTIVSASDATRPTPNPNVLIELGYAAHALGWQRIVLVQNAAFGGPEKLPFDLRQKRVLTYESQVDAAERSATRKQLQAALASALPPILNARRAVARLVDISLGYKKVDITSEIHHYELDLQVVNVGRRRIDDWEIEVELPTRVMEANLTVGIKVRERSDANRSLFRVVGRELKEPLRPGDRRRVALRYYVDDHIFSDREEVFAMPVRVRVLVDGEIIAETEKPFRDLQNF